MAHPDDNRWMQLARALGRRGWGTTWPNPAVGCVLVKDGRVIGRGWTQPGGRPHAEVRALTEAGAAARGATAYVTLEPCAHTGKTPPCVGALIAAGIARCVIPMADPDPRTNGAGIAALRAAGITVDIGVQAAEAAVDHEGFLRRVNDGRPMLTLKLATSLDGRIATASGESQWITGPDARRLTHAMRARHDAVLVGAGTARQDDPALTVRGLGMARQPHRVVVSRRLDLPPGGTLGRTARETPVWLVHGPDAPASRKAAWLDVGAALFEVATEPGGQLSPGAVLARLGAAGITRVFCEGGGQLAASLLSADLVDRLVVMSAGLTLGAEGTPAIGGMGIARLGDAPRFDWLGSQVAGGDIVSEWRRQGL